MGSGASQHPGVAARGVHHVGLTVSDLDASLAFYVDLLGGRRLFEAHQSGPLLAAALGVPNARLRLAFVAFGASFVELIDYRSPTGTRQAARPYDPGCVHVALSVADLPAACRRLRAAGVEVSEPAWVEDGPTAGAGFAYCRDPDGVIVELYQTTAALEALRGGVSG